MEVNLNIIYQKKFMGLTNSKFQYFNCLNKTNTLEILKVLKSYQKNEIKGI
jgi:hypothetical protein